MLKKNLFIFVLLIIYSAIALAQENYLQIKEIKGLVEIQKVGSQEWLPAKVNVGLAVGDKIRTFLESSVTLLYPDKSEFILGENSFLEVKDISENSKTKVTRKELKLGSGTMHYKVTPLEREASEFEIYSSTAIVGVTGTEGIIKTKGEDKPTENILLKGATYNTDQEGKEGVYQKAGNVYARDNQGQDLYAGDVDKEMASRLAGDETWKELLKKLVGDYQIKKSEGYLVKDVEEIIEKAFRGLEQRDYPEVERLIKKGNAYLEKARKLKNAEEFVSKLAGLKKEIEEKEKQGFNTKEAYLLLNEVEEALQNRDISKADNLIVLLIQKISSLPKEENNFLTDYQRIEESVLQREIKGFSVDEIKELLRQSYILYENKDYPKAITVLKEAEDKLNLTLKDIPIYLEEELKKIEANIKVKKQQGYVTENLELLVDEVKKLLKEENFLKAKEVIKDIGDRLLVVEKKLPLDWEIKISDLRKEIDDKGSLGLDLGSIYDYFNQLQEYKVKGDLVNLEKVYTSIKDALTKLDIPQGFKEEWQDFLDEFNKKESLGFSLKEVRDLKGYVQAALDKGDINTARTFLDKAKDKLNQTSDTQPPMVQILTFKETDDKIKVEGLATDNTKVKSVFINNSLVEVLETGEFSYTTLPSPDLETITIVASDISGNLSPPLVLNTKPLERDIKGEIKNVRLEYLEDSLLVKGEFAGGGKVGAGKETVFCDDKGNFVIKIIPYKELFREGIVVEGFNSDGTIVKTDSLTVEDKWAPWVEIKDVYFTESILPSLYINPLNYNQDRVEVSGRVEAKVMVTIEGKVNDLGLGEVVLKIFDRQIELSEDNRFSSGFSLSPRDTSAIVYLEDKAGNKSEKKIPLDIFLSPPLVKVNSEVVNLDSKGEFLYSLALTKELREILVEVEDVKGNILTSQKLAVADVLEPVLEVSSILYTKEEVTISGITDRAATIEDKSKSLFTESLKAQDNGMFTLRVKRPDKEIEALLIAYNLEGKVSKEVPLKIQPLLDEKAPSLFVSQPLFKGNSVVIEGFVSDDTAVERVTVQGKEVLLQEGGKFSYEVVLEQGLSVIEVIAKDISGKTVKESVVIEDKELPQIAVDALKVEAGKLVVKGMVKDNIGVKEVRLNNMPIAQGEAKELEFSYEAVLTGEFKEVTILAIDLYGNISKDGPRLVEIPSDTAAPQLKDIDLQYEGNVLYLSGKVEDPAGVKGVYIGGKEIDVFKDGSFKVKIDVSTKEPQIILEAPSYDKGKVTIRGKAIEGEINPYQVVIETEDVLGNKSGMFTRKVELYRKEDIKIFIGDEVVGVDSNGNFIKELALAYGEKTIEIEAKDPLGNTYSSRVDLETNPPVLEVSELKYSSEDKNVVISGKVKDSDSGVYSLTINGVKVDYDNEGNFSRSFSWTEDTLVVNAIDYIGNSTSVTKEGAPPDIWPPVFLVEVKPLPAIIGKPVHIEITSIDSHSGMPEILKELPKVTVYIKDKSIVLPVEGEGSKFIAVLDTKEFMPSIVEIKVEGEDNADNFSRQVEGVNSFTLTNDDLIAPSFSLEVNPSPMILGKDSEIRVFSSEDLKEKPSLEVELTDKTVQSLDLTKISEREYHGGFNLPIELPLGEVVLRLKGGDDLSGNKHDLTEKKVLVTVVEKENQIPLNIEYVEFNQDRLTLKGTTAARALIHIEFFKFSQDVVADEEGKFVYERYVEARELKELPDMVDVIRIKLKAKNYAGFFSQEKTLEVKLPDLPSQAGEYFNIQAGQLRVEQGEIFEVTVEPLKSQGESLAAFISFADGKKFPFTLGGGEKTYQGKYLVAEDSAIGRAMFEVVSGNIRESIYFDVVMAGKWMKKLKKDDFYRLKVVPDPMIKGKDVEFFLETQADLEELPDLTIVFPDNRKVNLSLSGSKRSFQGKYLCPLDIPSGKAELIINAGTPEQVVRVSGVTDEVSKGGVMGVYLVTNPDPIMSSAPCEVKVNFLEKVSFVPQLALQLSNGETIKIGLTGTLPSNRFEARFNLTEVPAALASFVLKDDTGKVIGTFPARISPSFKSKAGVNIFIIPEILRRQGQGTIQLNSPAALKGKLEGHLTFSDGRKIIVNLEGKDKVYRGNFVVPQNALSGMAAVEVFDEARNLLGASRFEVREEAGVGAQERAGIFLEPPVFAVRQKVRVRIEAGTPFSSLPKAMLLWEGGSLVVPLRGNIPGNRFEGEFTAPAQEIASADLEVRDEKGVVIGSYHLEKREGARQGRVELQPYPPVTGKPLIIKVFSPQIIDFTPGLRLIFAQGLKDLKLYGALPGDTFTATLEKVESPLQFIEVVDKGGSVLIRLPVEILGKREPIEFDVQPLSPIIAGETVSLSVRSSVEVPFVPRLRLEFGGKGIDVPLMGKPFSREFLGKVVVSKDVPLTSVKGLIFDPQGELIWQRVFMQEAEQAGMLTLNIMPQGDTGFELSWEALRAAALYELRYGEDEALKNKVEVKTETRYSLKGLTSTRKYYFQVIAFDAKRREIVRSSVISAVCGQTRRELFVQDIRMGKEVRLMWEDYYGVDNFRVSWGNASGSYPNSRDLKARDFVLPDLARGSNYFIRVFALKEGKVIGESREITVYLEDYMPKGVEIRVNPEPPQTGGNLEVFLHFFEDIYFIPKVIFSFADGRREFLTGTGEKRDFKASLSKDKFTSGLVIVDVEDDKGMRIGDRFFGEQGTSSGRPKMDIVPYPPIAGQSLSINMEIPVIVPMSPRLRFKYNDGSMREFNLSGSLPGNKFSLKVDKLEKPLLGIDIVDPFGAVRETIDFVVTTTMGLTKNLELLISPDPPVAGQGLTVRLNFNQPSSFKPRAFLEFMDGRRKNYLFPQDIGSLSFEVIIPHEEFTSTLKRVGAEDDRGMLLIDRFVGQQPSGQGGGNIMVMPDPPMTGIPLNVKVDFPNILNFKPKLVLEFINGTRRELTFNQAGGNKTYDVTLPSAEFTQPLSRVAVFDDKGALLLAERFFGMGPAMGGGIEIRVNPEPPQMSKDLEVLLHFPQDVFFLPKVILSFADGRREFLPVMGTKRDFKATLLSAKFTNSLVVIDIEDDKGVHIADRFFGEEKAGFEGQAIFVDPMPPIVGSPLNIKVEIPMAVPIAPKIKLRYEDGSSLDMILQGTLPTNRFFARIETLTKPISSIDLLDPFGVVRDTLNLSVGAAGSELNIFTMPDIPVVGQPLNVKAEFYKPVYYTPRLFVEFGDGRRSYYVFPQGPGLTVYEISLAAAVITQPVKRVGIEDNYNKFLGDKVFGIQGSSGLVIKIMPDPPRIGESLILRAEFSQPTSCVPRVFIEFEDNIRKNYGFPQPAGLLIYEMSISGSDITKSIKRIGVETCSGEFLGDRVFGPGGMVSGVNLMVNPYPPISGQALSVKAEFPQNIPFVPRLFIVFEDGVRKNYVFPQLAGLMRYEIFIPQADINQPVSRLGVESDTGMFINEITFGAGSQNQGLNIFVTPDPPTPGQSLTVKLEFPQTVSFKPQVFIEFADKVTKSFYIPTEPPANIFSVNIPGSEIYQLVDRIIVKDNQGGFLKERSFVSTGYDRYLDLSSVSSTSIYLNWPYIDWASSHRILYGTAPGSYNSPGSPLNIGKVRDYTLTGLTTGFTYYLKVEYFDITGKLIHATDEKFINLGSGNVAYPTSIWSQSMAMPGEVKVLWSYVSGVNGYKVYFGRSRGSYNEPGSPILIDDSSITQVIVSGLLTGVPYYFTVTGRMADGTESIKPQEIEVFPGSSTSGTGNLRVSPAKLDFEDVNTGQNTETLSVNVSNTSSFSSTVKTIVTNLTNTLDMTTTISSSNVYVSATSFTLAGLTSQNVSVYVSVPSTGVNPGDYRGEITFYDDVDGDNFKDSGESFAMVELWLMFGAEGLEILEGHLDFGYYSAGTTTSWGTFHIKNSSTTASYSSLRAINPTLVKFPDFTTTISSSNVTTELPTSPLAAGQIAEARIKVNIPLGTVNGEYGGMVAIYNDADGDNTIDGNEPLETFGIHFWVGTGGYRMPITDLVAQDRAVGGTIDLYWNDPNFNTNHYHIYYAPVADFLSFGSPQKETNKRAYQVSGLTTGVTYKFTVRSVESNTEDTGNYYVVATPTGGGTTTPPTFAGIKKAYANGLSGQVVLSWDSASDNNTPITYYIDYGTTATSLTQPATATSTTYTATGLADGTVYYFRVRAKDSLGNMEMNNHIETAKPYGIHHITISGNTTSTIGTAVLVKLTAYTSTNDSVVASDFSDSVNITVVSESSYNILNSWLLSIQDRMTGKIGEVEMANGIGYFTVDALEPETITINTLGINSQGQLAITFGPKALGGGAVNLVVQGPSLAITGSALTDGALIWVSAVDSTGKVDKNYTSQIPITITDPNSATTILTVERGGATLGGAHPNYTYDFPDSKSDGGEVLFRLKNTATETVTFAVSELVKADIVFTGVSKYYIVSSYTDGNLISGGSFELSHEALGSRIKFTIYAATSSNQKVNGYKGTGGWTRVSESLNSNSSSYASPSSITFNDGVAEFYVENSEYETVTFNVTESGNPAITTGDVRVVFRATDITPPQVTNVVAETPYLIHIYFNEDIEVTNVLTETLYDNVGIINKVCWYEDNVTLHLASPLGLGSSQSLKIKGASTVGANNTIRDKYGNYIATDITQGFTVPTIDYQGGPNSSGDWFEIQPAKSPITVGETINVTVYHKNACGYLTGSNRANRRSDTDSATISYSGSGSVSGSPSLAMGQGQATFSITGATAGSVTITLTCGIVPGAVTINVVAP